MRSQRVIHAVDSHTEGMPTRVVTGGVGVIPGSTMNERRLYFMANLDDLRLFLMNEPRGHAAMSGAILQPPTRDDCDWGVVYIEVSGCLPMCGHGARRDGDGGGCGAGDCYSARHPRRACHCAGGGERWSRAERHPGECSQLC